MNEILYKELSYQINGLCFRVHRELGRFCRERQYADRLEELLKDAGIAYEREYEIRDFNADSPQGNKVDFLIAKSVIVDTKAKPYLLKEDYIQMQRYLQSARLKLGLLVNFRNSYLKPARILNSQHSHPPTGGLVDSHRVHGFSLVEIIIGVAVLALVVSAGWFSFSSYAARRELESGTARVAALVSEARNKTLAGEGDSAYGVHFEQDRAVLFRAPTYQAGSANNKTEILPSRISISSINFSNSEVVFKRLTGAALAAGSVTLSVRGAPSASRTISINALGTIETFTP